MRKILFTALISVFALACQAQVKYEIVRTEKPDSSFLKETIVEAVTPEQPRPTITVNYRLFRADSEVASIVEEIRKRARTASEEAAKSMNAAGALNKIADEIETLLKNNKK